MSTLTASVRAIAGDIAAGRVSAVEVCREALDRITRVNASLNAFNLIAAERALDRAADVDRLRTSGATLGPLAGVPIAIKDNMCVQRHAHDGVVAHSRDLRSTLRCDDRLEARTGGRGDRRQDELRRVRDGIVERELRVRSGAQPVGRRSYARRDRAVDRRPRSPHRAFRSRSAPIPVDRSGSPRPSAASPA